MTELLNKAYINFFVMKRDRRGMESLEWIAIAAALIMLIFAAYYFFGQEIEILGRNIIIKLTP